MQGVLDTRCLQTSTQNASAPTTWKRWHHVYNIHASSLLIPIQIHKQFISMVCFIQTSEIEENWRYAVSNEIPVSSKGIAVDAVYKFLIICLLLSLISQKDEGYSIWRWCLNLYFMLTSCYILFKVSICSNNQQQ